MDARGLAWVSASRLLMRFAHRIPSRAPLTHFIDLLWLSEGYVQPHAAERLLPTGSMDLVVNLNEHSGADSISGARSRFAILDTSRPLSMVGVRFKPGGGFAFFDLPAGELQDCSVSLKTLWRGEAERLREQLLQAQTPAARFDVLERVLLQRLCTGQSRSAAVRYAIARFTDSAQRTSVAEVVERVGFSQRHFIATFRDEVGLTPKVFSRLARFRRAIDSLQAVTETDWSALALECGYFDQAHFIHDFREFAGVSPSAYLRHRTSSNHVRMRE